MVPSILRPYKGCDPLLPSEISADLQKCSSSSAPRPDSISYAVWQRVYLTSTQLLTGLLSPRLKFGYHTVLMKKANCLLLDMPGKPSTNKASLFTVIDLLRTGSHIIERVIDSCLSLSARTQKLVHHNQFGSFPTHSSLASPW